VKNIVVVGYPKSGCTWITRLVAELVGCPVAGFWKSNKREIAVEGEHRSSDVRVFKSHHTFDELGVAVHDPETRIIYVVRDPRDVAVSGANYFHFHRYPALERFFHLLPSGDKLYKHTLYHLVVPENYRIERMTEAVLHGSASVHQTVGISWKVHRDGYERRGVFMISYEAMLAEPEEQSCGILQYLGVQRSAAEIATAVRNQSFDVKKSEFLQKGERGRAKFMRIGKSGQWRDKLPERAKQLFARHLPNLGMSCARER
jgi:hypothetical protein